METYFGKDENVQVCRDQLKTMHEAKQQASLITYDKLNRFGKMHPKVFEDYKTKVEEVSLFFINFIRG